MCLNILITINTNMCEKTRFKSEFILQKVTRNNLEIFDLKLITSEIQYSRRRFDTLAFDENTKSFVIIEYKNKIDFNVLNQSFKYYKLLLSKPKVYIDRYNEVFNKDFNESDFEWDKSKVLIIGPKFSDKQIEYAKDPKWPFEIWKTTLCNNNCIYYENLESDEVKKLPVSNEDLSLTENDLLENRTPKVKDLYFSIKSSLKREFNNVQDRILINAVSYRTNKNLICKVNFLKNSLNIFFYTGSLKGHDNIEDISNKKTEGKARYKFKLESKENMDNFIELFKQAYEESESYDTK